MLEIAVMPITYRCNCNCIMCSIPKRRTKDLPLAFYDRIFDDNNLNCIRSINITGGEPFLREDLRQIVEIILLKCRHLSEIIISTNGTLEKCTAEMEYLLGKYPTCSFIVSVSLDAINEHADEVRGYNGVYRKQTKTLIKLKHLEKKYHNLKTVACMTITKRNYMDVMAVFEWANKHDILVDYIYATINTAYIDSAEKKELFVMNDEENEKLVSDLRMIYQNRLIASDKVYYENLFEKLLKHTKKKRDCINHKKKGILIEADGTVRACGMDDRFYIGNLLEESFTEIIHRELPNLDDVCERCLTNSYNAYTKEAQAVMAKEMLQEVNKLRLEHKRCIEGRVSLT